MLSSNSVPLTRLEPGQSCSIYSQHKHALWHAKLFQLICVLLTWHGPLCCAAGHATGGRTNDLLLLELSAYAWSQPVTSGTAPSPRSNAAITVANGHYLIIHGGRNNFVLDDIHMLDLLTRSWIDVSGSAACPTCTALARQLCLHAQPWYKTAAMYACLLVTASSAVTVGSF